MLTAFIQCKHPIPNAPPNDIYPTLNNNVYSYRITVFESSPPYRISVIVILPPFPLAKYNETNNP